MAGAAISPLTRPMSPGAAAANSPLASRVSAVSIHNVAEKLAVYAHSTQVIDVALFFTHCISLARGIDSAIANNEFPAHVMELPKIFKQISQGVKEDTLQPALMVLLISVKNACKVNWFPHRETQELLDLVDEVGKNFCTPEGFNCEQDNVLPVVVRIISRYHPCVRLGHILASVDVKPGFEACVVDFHVPKNIAYSVTEKIRMMVAKKDSIDTSACLITPQNANFLLNGKSVQGRSAGCMDPRPQSPTSVNHMIKYGTNLLQAVGNFDAHYVVLIAFMSAVPHTDLPAPQDYIRPTSGAVDADTEIAEVSSKVSLNCPISSARVRIPAKGRLCKHLQCFDLGNYIEMNSRRPSWKCPLCNQAVCFLETQIDQHMTKILKTVPDEVSNVIISSDGSWEFVHGSENYKYELLVKAPEGPPRRAPHLTRICDLIEDDVDMIPVREDRTPKGNGEQRATMDNDQQSSSRALAATPPTNSLQQPQNAQTSSSPRGYATPNSASGKPITINGTTTDTAENPRMHALSPRASSFRDPAQQRQVPQSKRPSPASQVPQLRAGASLRFTEEELRMIRENARRARERTTLPTRIQMFPPPTAFRPLPTRIQTLPPPTALRPGPIPSSIASAGRPPTSQGPAQDPQPDESWRPAGRMRGSLAGRAADALSDMIIRPSQAAPPSTPPPAPPREQMTAADFIANLNARRNSGSQPNAPQKK